MYDKAKAQRKGVLLKLETVLSLMISPYANTKFTSLRYRKQRVGYEAMTWRTQDVQNKIHSAEYFGFRELLLPTAASINDLNSTRRLLLRTRCIGHP